MNKTELIDSIAGKVDLSKAAVGRVLNAFMEEVKGTLGKGNKEELIGFGTFLVSERGARTGRNIQTGQTIKIPARKVPRFRAGKALKDAVR